VHFSALGVEIAQLTAAGLVAPAKRSPKAGAWTRSLAEGVQIAEALDNDLKALLACVGGETRSRFRSGLRQSVPWRCASIARLKAFDKPCDTTTGITQGGIGDGERNPHETGGAGAERTGIEYRDPGLPE